MNIGAAFTGNIGLPEISTSNSTPYFEYRQQYLEIGCPLVNIGAGNGPGSNQIRLNILGNTTINVQQSGQSQVQGSNAIEIIGSGNITANINRGDVGFAIRDLVTATVTTLNVGYVDTPASDANVVLGPGAACTTLNMSGGTVSASNAPTTVKMTDGALTVLSGNITSLTIDGGSCNYNGTGTITEADVSGIMDFREDMRTRTITTLKLYKGSEYHDPFGTVTITNPIQFINCSPADVILDVASNVEMSLAPI
jgi:hypothetical protein